MNTHISNVKLYKFKHYEPLYELLLTIEQLINLMDEAKLCKKKNRITKIE